MRNLAELGFMKFENLNPKSPASDSQIEAIEESLEIKLPESYIEFLKEYNGGYPRVNAFDVEGEEWELDHFFHLSEEANVVNDTESVQWRYAHRFPGTPQAVLPIAGDALGNVVYLDLTDSGGGMVVFWIHDPMHTELLPIANSFEEFIDALKQPSEID